tara:strand:+ start:3253 stop:4215 length:963 start_codon:yes stop_codon:yes gene_type:complete
MQQIWITWEKQRRNQTTSSALGVKLIELDYKSNPLFRYSMCIFKTLAIIFKLKPKLIFVQNPSIVLATLAILVGKCSKIKIVVDAHNAGIYPAEGKYFILNKWANFLIKSADMTIVTNKVIASYVENLGGTYGLLPDPLPELHRPDNIARLAGEKNILFVCSWAEDEPYLEVIKAAAKINSSINIYITGNWRKKEKELPNPLPKNVILLGFVSTEKFDELLFSADVIMDLTTRKDCMVCGAYEAVAAQKPQILSKTPVLEDYFAKGAIFTENNSEAIAETIDFSLSTLEALQLESDLFKTELSASWLTIKEKLENDIKSL